MRHLKLAGVDKLNIIKKIIEFAEHNASQTHKLTAISSIFDYALTTQQFIMVGDSGELDPEVRRGMKERFRVQCCLDLWRNCSKISGEN